MEKAIVVTGRELLGKASSSVTASRNTGSVRQRLLDVVSSTSPRARHSSLLIVYEDVYNNRRLVLNGGISSGLNSALFYAM